jgi:hypothetical protein
MQTVFLIDWPEGGWGFSLGFLMGMALASGLFLIRYLAQRNRRRF